VESYAISGVKLLDLNANEGKLELDNHVIES